MNSSLFRENHIWFPYCNQAIFATGVLITHPLLSKKKKKAQKTKKTHNMDLPIRMAIEIIFFFNSEEVQVAAEFQVILFQD